MLSPHDFLQSCLWHMHDTTMNKHYQAHWHACLSQHIWRLYSSLCINQYGSVLPRAPRRHDRLRMQWNRFQARPRNETKVYWLQSRRIHNGLWRVFRILHWRIGYCNSGCTTPYTIPILRANNNIRPKLLSVHIFGTLFKWNGYKSWVTPCCSKEEPLSTTRQMELRK